MAKESIHFVTTVLPLPTHHVTALSPSRRTEESYSFLNYANDRSLAQYYEAPWPLEILAQLSDSSIVSHQQIQRTLPLSVILSETRSVR